MTLKLEYWIILSLGFISVGIILWFLFSDASPLSAPTFLPPDLVVQVSEVPIEIKRSGEAYWTSAEVGDTIDIGDMLRSNSSGNVNLMLANVGLVIANGPFEFSYIKEKKRLPATLLVYSGALQYLVIRDRLRVPINISSPDGEFSFSTNISASQINDILFENNSGDLNIKVYSGTGLWSENSQIATVRPGEILLRNRQSGELRKENIFKATDVLAPERDMSYYPGQMMRGFNFVWSEVQFATDYRVRVIQLTGDSYEPIQYYQTQDNSYRILNKETGIYKIQVTSMLNNSVQASWTPPVYFSVNRRYKDNMCNNLPQNGFIAEFIEIEDGYLLFGCYNGTEPERNHVITYTATDTWSIQPFTSNYLSPIATDGYFETFVRKANQATLLIATDSILEFKFEYPLSERPDIANKDRIKVAFQLTF
jgi:hypothetical protein